MRPFWNKLYDIKPGKTITSRILATISAGSLAATDSCFNLRKHGKVLGTSLSGCATQQMW